MSKWCGRLIATEKKLKKKKVKQIISHMLSFHAKAPQCKDVKIHHFAFSLISQHSTWVRTQNLAMSSVHLLTNPSAASLSDPAHLYEVHPRSGHHDLF